MEKLHSLKYYEHLFKCVEVDISRQLLEYKNDLLCKLKAQITMISEDNFWETLPVIIGLDSKLILLMELLKLAREMGLSDNELIHLVERDYIHHNKELCGYRLNEPASPSLIFNAK